MKFRQCGSNIFPLKFILIGNNIFPLKFILMLIFLTVKTLYIDNNFPLDIRIKLQIIYFVKFKRDLHNLIN